MGRQLKYDLFFIALIFGPLQGFEYLKEFNYNNSNFF